MADLSAPAPVSDIEKARAEAKAKLAKQEQVTNKKKEEPKKDGRTDAQLTKDIAASLRGIFEVIRYAARFFGKRNIPALSADEAAEGAIYWVPLARRYYALAQITLFIGAPVWLLTTLSRKWGEGEAIADKPKPPPKKEVKNG